MNFSNPEFVAKYNKPKEQREAYYGLPKEVKFCKSCVMSNQRPASTVEFKHTKDSKKVTLNFDENDVCDACRTAEQKELINWEKREEELIQLLDKHRSKDGSYDCLVPGSGGKDSAYQAHILKYKYGMNPLTVTWPPILYTDYGYKNWKNWIDSGFDNISFNRNGKTMKLLTKLSIENLFHPFQTFILGQKNLAPKIAAKYGIPLIFYGENEAEYGNPIADNATSLRDKSYYSYDNLDEVYLGGVSIRELRERYNVPLNDLLSFLPADAKELERSKIEVHYLGYYLKWTPQEVYYYAVENTGFKARPFRTQGTYSKYNSIDDKIDDLHYYTTFIKFGIGRATYDASQEIRNKHLTREDGVALVKKFDGEFPDKYFNEIMEYLDINPDYFRNELSNKFRSPHLWGIENNEWKLRHNVMGTGLDD
ncbi:MAG: N-acetyl sugar amidotransferase [Chitinophagaceae bacterium]